MRLSYLILTSNHSISSWWILVLSHNAERRIEVDLGLAWSCGSVLCDQQAPTVSRNLATSTDIFFRNTGTDSIHITMEIVPYHLALLLRHLRLGNPGRLKDRKRGGQIALCMCGDIRLGMIADPFNKRDNVTKWR